MIALRPAPLQVSRSRELNSPAAPSVVFCLALLQSGIAVGAVALGDIDDFN